MVAKPIKILYIEDDASSRMLIKKILRRFPITFLEAETGLAGLQKAQQEHPDLILMDINLPDISGTELATKIKSTPELEDIIVVALTAINEPDAREITLIAGCDGFLTKPIDLEKFPEQVFAFLKGKREILEGDKQEFYRRKYEKSLVDRLTAKVQELEESNRKLAHTSQKLQLYSENLEKILEISSRLQMCSSPNQLKKQLVNEICDNFEFDRCIFIDVDVERMMLAVNYAHGFTEDIREKLNIPFDYQYFQKLFREKQVIHVRGINKIRDVRLKNILKESDVQEFLFAYLGTPMSPVKPSDLRERIKPLLETTTPTLYNQDEADIELIIEHLQEYMSSESLYRGGFIFMDNYRSKRKIVPEQIRLLETFFRTTGYIYQNLLLMEELRFLFIRAEKEAITDHLTNLYNYRYFIQQLNREISRARRHHTKFSLMMIDIDFFKQYNDTFGHQAGDVVLQRIARLMMENTRSSDIVARYGGEEFVIICPELNKTEAIKMAEKLRTIIEKTPFPNVNKLPSGKLSISLGVATFPDDAKDAATLIKKADEALYLAKSSGRNCVRTLSA